MAAVRANIMQTITSKRILIDGQPSAATISAARANGSAKIVCENRINRRNRTIAPLCAAVMIIGLLLWRALSSAHSPDSPLETADSTVLIGRANQWETSRHRQNRTALFPGMMRLGRFWFGRFFGWLFLGLKPLGVKDPGLINALVGVRAKEITLCLQEIRWKAS